MLAKLRSRLEEKEQGFTLVELLVVIIIIGILAAIAIPLYLGQQAKAKDSAAKSDLKNWQIEVANVLAEDADIDTWTEVAAAADFVKSPGVTQVGGAIDIANETFCIGATVTGGKVGSWAIDQDGKLYSGATTCSAAATS